MKSSERATNGRGEAQRAWSWIALFALLVTFYGIEPVHAHTGARLPRIASFDISLYGLAATVEPLEATVPKNTASGIRILVTAGDRTLTTPELAEILGGPFEVHAELSGPGLSRAITLPELGPSDPLPADPLVLALPPVPFSGDYRISNIRIVRNGVSVLDVTPSEIPLKVIEQILVTSVTTRSLTLAEILERGIVLDGDDYVAFEFTLGLATESQSVSFSIPVVFDREGVPVPSAIEPPTGIGRSGIVLQEDAPEPLIRPALLELEAPPGIDPVEFEQIVRNNGEPIRIPSVLVIPGNVGYLKQFFSAQLFVANGAPVGSGLTVRDVTGTVTLPPGADLIPRNEDDPLALPETVRGVQPRTMAVLGIGPDGLPATADDVSVFRPTEQGQAEFLIRGEKEGFHELDFDINATLEGLPIGPVAVKGRARGGVLVRNPFFDMTFTVPSVVRAGEPFSIYATVTNIGQGIANDVSVTLDASRMAGATLVGSGTQQVDTLRTGDARTLEYRFTSQRTGQVVATYLNFDPSAAGGGRLNFSLGVGERGVALSPDTLVLPSAVDALPAGVVAAAMRVLGQAWSISNAPSGTLPPEVLRINRSVTVQKAQALAEAGLRASLGQPVTDAVRDLVFDFYGSTSGVALDPGFDQLLRETEAGHGLARAAGAALETVSLAAGGAQGFGRTVDSVAVSGPDFMRVAIGSGSGAPPVSVVLRDSAGRSCGASTELVPCTIPGAVWLPLSSTGQAPWLGVVTAPGFSTFTLELTATAAGNVDLGITLPRGGGTFARSEAGSVALASGDRVQVIVDPRRPDVLLAEIDRAGDGDFDESATLAMSVVTAPGPTLLSATVVGPETLDGAGPFGFHTALLFDRVVASSSAADTSHYAIPDNAVLGASAQLSGRIVFASLAQPEGPYIPTTFTASGLRDTRGATGPARTVPLACRLEDPGAVVSGHVVGPDGTPLSDGAVTYVNNSNWQCAEAPPETARSGFAAVELDAQGHYEFRYVRQDECGYPWGMRTNDPSTGALRSVSGFVQVAGEHIVADIALLGQGTVTGRVLNLTGAPVPGAQVAVVSQTDPQVGGVATTDGDGRYTVYGITVGNVSVRAAKDEGVGQSAGYVGRAGGVAIVDITIDSGAAAIAGRVLVVEGATVRAVPGLSVVYEAEGVPVAVALTDADGGYSFESVPVGPYTLVATLNARDRTRKPGVIAAGDVLINVDIVISVPAVGGVQPTTGPAYGTVAGTVRFPNGDPAPGVNVAIDNRGVLSGDDGAFSIPGVLARPGVAQSVTAQSRDGLRSGSAVAFVNERNQVVSGVTIALSGLGSAQFTVVGPNNAPVSGLTVGLLNRCEAECGCAPQTTDAQGRVRFDGLPLGTATARVVRSGVGFVDVATANASITRDGEVAQGTLHLAGAGVVSGFVRDADGLPIFGADVTLHASVFNSEYCSLGGALAQRVRTGTDGSFRFVAVNVGGVSVSASQTFYPTPASASGALTAANQELSFNLVLDNTTTTAGELSGIVYLPDGVTPAGAGIEVTASGGLPDVVVSTDAQGRYRFAEVFPEGWYTLTARDTVSGGLARSSVSLRAGQDAIHDMRLLGRGTVLVRVVDAADQPVQDAFVTLSETGFPGRVFEGAADAANQGVVRFENVFEGSLSATASDRFGRGGRASSVLTGPGATLDLRVRLSMTGNVAGVFVQPDGVTPIPFGAVTLVAAGRVIGQSTTQGSGTEVGRFSFEHVPAGPVRVDAQDPITARTGSAYGTITQEGQLVDLVVRANGVGTVEGLVTSNGVAQAGAEVQLTAGPLRANSVADAQGRYRITGVPEGPVSVSANLGDGFLAGSASASLVGDGTTLTLNVALADSGRVVGRVVRADGVTAAPTSFVTLRIGATTFSTTTHALGGFAFERVPAGSASLSAELLGSIDRGSATTQVPASGAADVTITLNGTGAIGGRALAANGAATAGTLTLSGTGSVPYTLSAAVGADGNFAFPEVFAGPFTASLAVPTSSGFTLYGLTTGTLNPNQQLSIDVRVQPSGTVVGRALRSNGAPALGSAVTLVLSGGRGSFTLYTDGDGRFSAPGLPGGGFDLYVNDPFTSGYARRLGLTLSTTGETLDVGDIVLDDTPVTAIAFEPTNDTLQVALQQPIRVTFSDPLASAGGIAVSTATSSVGANAQLAADGMSVTLTGTWPDASEIVVTATTAVTDIFGRHPLAPVSSRFRTIDVSAPHVVSVEPANGAIEIAADTVIEVTFHEDVDALTDAASLVSLSTIAGNVPGTSQRLDARRFRFTPSASLAGDTRFTVRAVGARDGSGNAQTTAFTSSFATHDTQPPALALTQPTPGSWTNVARPQIVVSLSDSLSGIAAESSTLALDGVTVTPSRSASSLSYTPTADLADGAHAVHATVQDRAGNSASLDAEVQVDRVAPGPAELAGVSAGQALTGALPITASALDVGSGVQRIRVYSDGVQVLELLAPAFAGTLNSASLSDGAHILTARALDYAGNLGVAGPAVSVVVNNLPMTVTFTAPIAGVRVRDSVAVAASVSEPVQQVTFAVGGNTVTDTTAPYSATLSLSGVPEGTAMITATALGLLAEDASTMRSIFVDLTPPAAPDPTRVFAEPPDNGLSLVYGQAGAVEAAARVLATNLTTGAIAQATAASDGAFATNLAAISGHVVSLVAFDVAGNASAATTTTVRSTTSLPPVTATLAFEGRPWDRVRAVDLTTDGAEDAVFSLTFALGTGITRQLAFVDLEAGGVVRSTRLFGASALGVAVSDLGGAFLNHEDGNVDAQLSGSVALVLFAADDSFIQAGTTYRATAAFTNGARYVGSVTVAQQPSHEITSSVFSAHNQALPFDPSSAELMAVRDTSSLVFSVHNQSLPFDPSDAELMAVRDTSSLVFSVHNQSLPFDPADAELMAVRDTSSLVFSVHNQSLPFDPADAELMAVRDTSSLVFSVHNQSLPFDPSDAELMAVRDTSSLVFSVNNDPTAPTGLAAPEPVAMRAAFAAPSRSEVSMNAGDALGAAGMQASSPLAGETVIAVEDISTSEAAREVRVRATLSAPSAAPVTASYASTRGSATAGSEYDSVWGTVSFEPGSVEQEIRVPLHDDTLHEPDETLLLTLSNPQQATIEQADAVVTLIDDDLAPAPGAAWLFDDFESEGLGFRAVGAGELILDDGVLFALGSGLQSTEQFAVGVDAAAVIARARVRFAADGQAFGFNVHRTDAAANVACYFESALGPSGEVDSMRAVVQLLGPTGWQTIASFSIALEVGTFVDLAIEHGVDGITFYVDGFDVGGVSLSAEDALSVGLWNPDAEATLETDWIEVRPRMGEAGLCREPVEAPRPDGPEYCAPQGAVR